MRRVLQGVLTAVLLIGCAAPAVAAPSVLVTWTNPDALAVTINVLRAPGLCSASSPTPCVFSPVPGSPVAGTATSFTDTDAALVDGGSYTYSVTATDAAGTSLNNPQVGVTIPLPLVVPASRSNLKAVPTP